MEEILQLFVELFLQFFIELFADVIWRNLPEPARLLLKAVLYVIVAAVLGWISTLLAPEPLIPSETLRLLYLLIAPVLIGLAMAWIGRFLENRNKERSSLEGFGMGWLFAFTFALTRYLISG